VYVEQRLGTCEVCGQALALQYHWGADRVPSSSRDRILVRCFPCPRCGHVNPFFTLMYAYGFELKAVPGPDREGRVHPNSLRRLWLNAGADASRHAASTKRPSPWLWGPRTLEPLWPFVLWWLARLFPG